MGDNQPPKSINAELFDPNSWRRKSKLEMKRIIIAHLTHTPIIGSAIREAGIGRTSFNRWLDEDDEFRIECKKATEFGNSVINDEAEERILEGIHAGHIPSVLIWLRHHHPTYSTQVTIANSRSMDSGAIPEQENRSITNAVRTARLIEPINKKIIKENQS